MGARPMVPGFSLLSDDVALAAADATEVAGPGTGGTTIGGTGIGGKGMMIPGALAGCADVLVGDAEIDDGHDDADCEL